MIAPLGLAACLLGMSYLTLRSWILARKIAARVISFHSNQSAFEKQKEIASYLDSVYKKIKVFKGKSKIR